MFWGRLGLGLAGVLAGCGPVIGVPEDDGSTTGGGVPEPPPSFGESGPTTHADEVTTDEPVPPPMTTAAESTSTTTTTSASDSHSFNNESDGGGVTIECDIWAQDCPRDEKCMPWANDGGGAWNATRCSPLDPNPAGIGDECIVEGSGVSGIDNCGIAAMCWDVDPETNMGECVGFCEGSEANPSCADECSNCYISSEGVLTLCLEGCDPLAQDCEAGDGCYVTNDAFTCVVDISDTEGAFGTACDWINDCDPGAACLTSDALPACEGNNGCCAPFCSVEVADPCDALVPGTVCTPWFEEGQAPPETACVDYPAIGVCVLP